MLFLVFTMSKHLYYLKPFAHTCLHIACKKGSIECFNFLIQEYYSKRENIPFIDQCDSLGNTPLALAIKFFSNENPSNYLSIIENLIKNGRFNIEMRNNDDETLAHLVIKNRSCPPKVRKTKRKFFLKF